MVAGEFLYDRHDHFGGTVYWRAVIDLALLPALGLLSSRRPAGGGRGEVRRGDREAMCPGSR